MNDARDPAELLPNQHPGEMLRIDFLEPMGITPYRLAKSTGMAQSHVAELVSGKRNVTMLTSVLLGRFFGMSEQFWMNLQNHYDLIEIERNQQARIGMVQPHTPALAA